MQNYDSLFNLYNRCKHPIIRKRIKDPSTGKKYKFTLTGGRNPDHIKHADVIVYLDSLNFTMDNRGMINKTDKHVIFFPIVDGQTPEDRKEFDNLIKTLGRKLFKGQHIHITCIGGHGRTGTVMACLLGRYLQIEEPVSYIRAIYCKEAVETLKQHHFVNKYTGKGIAPDPKDYNRRDSLYLMWDDKEYKRTETIERTYAHSEGKTTVMDADGNFLYEFEQSQWLFNKIHGKEETKKREDDILDTWYIKRYGFNRADFLTRMRAPENEQSIIAETLTEEFKRERERVSGYYEPEENR